MSNETGKIIPFPFPSRGLLASADSLLADSSYSPYILGMRVYSGEYRPFSILDAFAQTPGGSGVVTLDNAPLEMTTHLTSDRILYPIVGTRSKIYRWSGGGTSSDWLDLTGSATFTGTDTDPWTFTPFFDTLYFSNGLDGLWKWPGTGTISQVLTVGSARYLTTFAGRIIGAHTYIGGTVNSDEVRWSGYLTPESWDPALDPTSGYNTLNLEVPGPVTGLHVHGGNQLLVFKRNAIFSMIETGLVTPAFAFRLVVTNVGCIAGRTILSIGGGKLIFLGADNVYIYDGSSFPQPVGNPIRAAIFGADESSSSTRFGEQYARQAFAFHVPLYNEYWLCLPWTSATAKIAFVYNYVDNTWSQQSLASWTCATEARSVSYSDPWDSDSNQWNGDSTIWDVPAVLDERLFPIIGRSDTKQTFSFSSSAVASDALVASFQTSDTHFDLPLYRKSLDRIYITATHTTASLARVSVSTDHGVTWTLAPTQRWPSSAGQSTLVFRLPRVTGHLFRVRYECSGTHRIIGAAALVIPRSELR